MNIFFSSCFQEKKREEILGTTSDSKGGFHLLIKENAFWDALFVTDTDNKSSIVVDVAAVGDGYRV